MTAKRHLVAFGVTAKEKAEIEAYRRQKKRWRTTADLARDALWQMINRNQPGLHRKAPQKGPSK